jgi:hypothetical protein
MCHQLQINLAHMYCMQVDGTHHYQPYNETRWHTQYPLSATAWIPKGLSCETQLIECVDDITRNIDAGKQTDCLIMDFSKAFDKVSHSLLQHKLDHYGIRGKTCEWIKPFLSDRSQSVVIEGESSNKIPVQSGAWIPQDSVLGPSLFLFLYKWHARRDNIESETFRKWHNCIRDNVIRPRYKKALIRCR